MTTDQAEKLLNLFNECGFVMRKWTSGWSECIAVDCEVGYFFSELFNYLANEEDNNDLLYLMSEITQNLQIDQSISGTVVVIPELRWEERFYDILQGFEE